MIATESSLINVYVKTKQSLLTSFRDGEEPRSCDEEFASFKDVDRELLWRLGRYFIRQCVTDTTSISPDFANPRTRDEDLTILTRTGLGRGMRPLAIQAGKALPIRLSLSHSDDLMGLAVATASNTFVGLDIVDLEQFDVSALDLWFTKKEINSLRTFATHADRQEHASLIWSLKESLYKATNFGEPFRPHRWEILKKSSTIECFHNDEPVALSAFESRIVENHRITAVAVNTTHEHKHLQQTRSIDGPLSRRFVWQIPA